jgi:hypothetical protein
MPTPIINIDKEGVYKHMKKPKFYKTYGNKFRFDNDFDEFEPNPFDDESGDYNLADFVRGPAMDRGMKNVSRSYRSPRSGVYMSRYDDLVRDIEDIERLYLAPDQSFDKDMTLDYDGLDYEYDGDDPLYITTRDNSYYKNEFNDEDDIFDIDLDPETEFMRSLEAEEDFEDDEFEEFEDDEFDEFDGDDDSEFSDDDLEDPDETRYEGVVRSVKGAYLVSKEEQPDETFKEIWMYNKQHRFEDEANIKNAILAGTDIDPTKNVSEDGTQEAVLQTVGNVNFLTILGLPN